jgi:hypothetical protein
VSVLGGALPPEVESAMFLRDGWPHCSVCKVLMKDGRVGIGVWRNYVGAAVSPEEFDRRGLVDALHNVAPEPPDYTPLHEHVAKMAAAAKQPEPEPDNDLQASLGQKAHD